MMGDRVFRAGPPAKAKKRGLRRKNKGRKTAMRITKQVDIVGQCRIFTEKDMMKFRISVHNHIGALALIAIIAGLFSSQYELSQLFLSNVVEPDALDYLIAISHFLFFTLLSGLLIYVNTRRIRRRENLRHFFHSLAVVSVFCLVAWWAFNPLIRKSNVLHEEIYAAYFRESEDNVWQNWEKEKRSYYFHDSGEDWIEKSVSLFLTIFVISRIYNMSRREEEMERRFEKLKNESLQSQISALNNQINPHFFFNALNALHSLIAEENTQKSLEYVSNLANIFRYILQSGKKDMVSLSAEFAFLETYGFMLSVKYGQRLKIDNRVDKPYEDYKLPVLSLLPIIENVSKHNEVSSRYPMVIELFVDGRCLVVRNEKRNKLDAADSGGIGLGNLNNRFKLLTGEEIKIENNAAVFSVYLPLVMP